MKYKVFPFFSNVPFWSNCVFIIHWYPLVSSGRLLVVFFMLLFFFLPWWVCSLVDALFWSCCSRCNIRIHNSFNWALVIFLFLFLQFLFLSIWLLHTLSSLFCFVSNFMYCFTSMGNTMQSAHVYTHTHLRNGKGESKSMYSNIRHCDRFWFVIF